MLSVRRRLVPVLLGSAALSMGVAWAQDPAPQPESGETPSASDTSTGLQEVIVTAEKRSANLQDTPIAISALPLEVIEARQINSAQDLNALAPSLTTNVPSGFPAGIGIFIRGMGGQNTVLTLDNAVGIYVDGIVLGRSTGAAFELAGLERVEVLRGPQGTLYGRNTVGGAVNLITKKPTDDFNLTQKVSFGNYGLFKAHSSINTGEFGNSGLRVSLDYLHDQRNGFIDNVLTASNEDPGAQRVNSIRAAARFDRGGAFRADYAFDMSQGKYYPHAFQLTVVDQKVADFFAGSVAAGGRPLTVSRERLDELAITSSSPMTDKSWGHTLTLEADLGENTVLRSLTGYRSWRKTNDAALDLDGNAGILGRALGGGIRSWELFEAFGVNAQHQLSQEVNLIGSIGDKFDYVAGAFYFKEHSRMDNPQNFLFITPAGGLGLSAVEAFRHESTSNAVFVQGTRDITDQFRLTGGVRYTWDERTLDQAAPAARARMLSSKFEKFNWSVTADYDLTDDVLAFARVATGYKAGGFNPSQPGNEGFAPENVTAYELGVKSDLLDRRLRLNASVFLSQLRDLQVQQFRAGSGGATGLTTNAGAVDYTGVELEVTAMPIDGLTLYANGGYIDRKYKQFIVRDPVTDQLVDIADRAEHQYTASTTISAGAGYEFRPWSFGQPSLHLDYKYHSKRYFNVSELGTPHYRDIVAGGVGLLDVRLAVSGIELGGAEATIALFGQNVTDEEHRLSGIDFGSTLGFAGNTYGDPMTWGIEAKIAF